MVQGRFHSVAASVALIAGISAADRVFAGNAYTHGIVAVTSDGAFQAVYDVEDGRLLPGRCGLIQAGREPTAKGPKMVVPAICEGTEGAQKVLLPIKDWKWEHPSPQLAALRPFDKVADGGVARIWQDEDTQVWHLELRQGDSWTVVRVIEGDAIPSINGVLRRPGGYLLRAAFEDTLNYWEEVWEVSEAELAESPKRQAEAQKDARNATARMRRHRADGTGGFASKPATTTREAWERRRRHGIATFIHKWEIAAAYGPLDATDLADAFWLLAWFESPARRYESLRWYTTLIKRDATGAAALLAELGKDQDTRGLAEFLANTRDHLRDLLPLIPHITDETLRKLSDEQLHWLHRWYRARVGYRFSEPSVAAYFALLPYYTPMSERRWQRHLKDPIWLKNPDAPLLCRVPGNPPDLVCEELKAIIHAENARGLGPPPL